MGYYPILTSVLSQAVYTVDGRCFNGKGTSEQLTAMLNKTLRPSDSFHTELRYWVVDVAGYSDTDFQRLIDHAPYTKEAVLEELIGDFIIQDSAVEQALWIINRRLRRGTAPPTAWTPPRP